MRRVLVEKRKAMKLTQEQVARQLGITRAFYGHIETGKRNPTLELAKAIADFFQSNIEEIFFTDLRNKSYRRCASGKDNDTKAGD